MTRLQKWLHDIGRVLSAAASLLLPENVPVSVNSSNSLCVREAQSSAVPAARTSAPGRVVWKQLATWWNWASPTCAWLEATAVWLEPTSSGRSGADCWLTSCELVKRHSGCETGYSLVPSAVSVSNTDWALSLTSTLGQKYFILSEISHPLVHPNCLYGPQRLNPNDFNPLNLPVAGTWTWYFGLSVKYFDKYHSIDQHKILQYMYILKVTRTSSVIFCRR